MRFTIIIACYLLCASVCYSQISSESHTIFTRKEGLSNNAVTSMVKDNRGFLWVGTTEGLNRFDGRHFITYYNDADDFSSLSGNNIFDIIQYKPGMLLIGTNNGVSIFNTVTNRFENEQMKRPALRKGSGKYVLSLFRDAQCHIYFNYGGKIDVFDQDLHFLYCLTDMDWGRSIQGIAITYEKCFQDREGLIWIPSDNMGICILDEKAKKVYSSANNPNQYPFMRAAPVRSFYYDELQQQVFVSYWGEGLEKYDLITGKKLTQKFNIAALGEARSINAITRLDNRLICCGSSCIYSVDPQTLLFTKMFQHSNDPATSYIDSYTALSDAENIWVGTETKGLLQIPNQTSLIQQLALPYPIRDYTSGCTAITQLSKDILYFAYGDEGLIELNQSDFHETRYPLPVSGGVFPYISKLLRYDDTLLLVGTVTGGLYFFDTQTKKYRRTNIFPSSTDHIIITAMQKDWKGDCWIASRFPNTLGHYEKKSNRYTSYPEYFVNGQQVFNPAIIISRMTRDQKGNIWMYSTNANGEIARHEIANDKWTTFGHGAHASKVFKGKEFGGLFVMDSIIWTGNPYGMGLIRYDYTKDSIQRVGRKQGLLSENIFAITSDHKKNLFISTQSGISYFNTVTEEARTLMIEDGNFNWGFSYAQFFDTLNNRLIYALNDRILIGSESLWGKVPGESVSTFIDEVKVNNEPLHFQDTTLKMNHNQRNISIQFTGINYSHNSKLQYGYKMVGVDKDWTMMEEANTINYSNLGPGKYNFLVKAKGKSGNWGPVNNSFQFTILPAIWQTSLFWIAAALFTSLIVILAVRRRIQYIRKGAELKHKLAETEMLALRSQMNPHFIFNCINAIDNLMQTKQSDKATTYLTRFAKLIRGVLENSKSNEIPFHKDLESLQLYLQLEQFRTSNKFSYELNADEELINGAYKIPPLIIQPFIENAILHGLMNKETEDRILLIEAKLKGSFICYTIADNGVGRKRALDIKERNRPEHKSYGISITAERLQLHNQQKNEKDILITDLEENGIASGTRIDVMIRIEH